MHYQITTNNKQQQQLREQQEQQQQHEHPQPCRRAGRTARVGVST